MSDTPRTVKMDVPQGDDEYCYPCPFCDVRYCKHFDVMLVVDGGYAQKCGECLKDYPLEAHDAE